MRSRWLNQFHEIEGASKFHNKVRELLASTSPFQTMKCFQEVPVIDLVPSYISPLHRVDWYVETLRTVLELHGEQHYRMTNRGGVSWNQAHDEFIKGKTRDTLKRIALEEAGFKYVEIPYRVSSKLDATLLSSLILD